MPAPAQAVAGRTACGNTVILTGAMTGLPRVPYLLLVAIGLVPVTGTATAREVYKWTGRDGSTHYSEKQPDGDMASLEVLQVSVPVPLPENPPAAASSSANYQATLEMARRLQADRLAREQARLERDTLRLKEREMQFEQQAQQLRQSPPAESYAIPYYYRSPVRRWPHLPWQPHTPDPGQGRMPPQHGYPPPWAQQHRYPRPLSSRTQQVQRAPSPDPGQRFRPE